MEDTKNNLPDLPGGDPDSYIRNLAPKGLSANKSGDVKFGGNVSDVDYEARVNPINKEFGLKGKTDIGPAKVSGEVQRVGKSTNYSGRVDMGPLNVRGSQSPEGRGIGAGYSGDVGGGRLTADYNRFSPSVGSPGWNANINYKIPIPVRGSWAFADGGSVNAQGIASLGRGTDSMLVHMSPREVGGLQQLAMSAGGSLTINPQTGLPEAGFLSSMLPMLAAAAAIYFTGGAAAPAVAGAEAAAAGAAASSIPASLVGAGAGALTGALTNKKNPLMGAITGGISGYGMGGVGEGLAQAGAAGGTEGLNASAEMAFKAPQIDKAVSQFDTFAPSLKEAGFETADAYRKFLETSQTGFDKLSQADLAKNLATPASQNAINANYQDNLMKGLKGLSSEQGRDAFIGTAASKGVPATGLGGGVGAAAKGIGLAAPLIASAMEPGNFTPPPVKPATYYKTSYNPPQYDPVTGTYSNPSYGPGTYSTTYVAQGGAVGYAGGGPAYYPLTGDGVNTGGLGGRGEKPKNSRDIYSDASGAGIYDDKAGEGPYSDSAGVGIHTNTPSGIERLFDKTSLATLERYKKSAKKAAYQAAASKKLRERANAVDDYGSETTSAAQGGLMGLNTYAAGGKLLRGPGDGMSDSIPAVINGAKPQRAALADGEFVIPADVVSHLGNGSTEAGSKRLYSMMDKVRRARTGNPKQGKQINPEKFMPA